MELLYVIAFIIILILLSKINSSQKKSAERSEEIFLSLKKELQELKLQFQQPKEIVPEKKLEQPKPSDASEVQWKPFIQNEPAPSLIIPTKEANQAPVEKSEPILVHKEEQPEPAESWWDKWVRNNPDLEKFVGENLANKVGIAVLVLGIGFFVKFAIDQNWIKETGRVFIGMGCGIVMIGIAHYLRNSYRAFSSVMAGGGIAVFYFTIAFAFHEYSMFSQTAAFIIMIVITAFAATIALLYNKVELAVIAVIGGFLAPFLVSNGSGNYVALFTYLLILNIGILAISYFKKWSLLHILSFLFTLIIFGGWLISELLSGKALPYKNALLFAAAFYMIFLAIVLINNLRTQKKFRALDFSLLMLITFSFYTEGMLILAKWENGSYQGLFTIILSVINLGLAWYLFNSQKGDKNLLYLLIGLTLTFLSLAAPVQLYGHSITMFWAAEAVLIYWLHQRSKINIFKYSSAIVLLLMLISLMIDWSIAGSKSSSYLPLIFINWQGIITNIITVSALGLYAYFLSKNSEDYYLFDVKNKTAAIAIGTASFIIAYALLIFGINLHFSDQQSFVLPNVYHQLVSYIVIGVTLFVLKKFIFSGYSFISFSLFVIAFLIFVISAGFTSRMVHGVIQGAYSAKHLYTHWANSLLILYLFYQLIKAHTKHNIKAVKPTTWIINVMLVIFFSIEFRHLYIVTFASSNSIPVYHAQYSKAGLTIVWATFSFVIMWLGMKYKFKTLRVISLTLFSAALLKLFLFDIRNISAGGKIAAFIMLGVLLLVISFMYHRLKKIIIDNEEKAD